MKKLCIGLLIVLLAVNILSGCGNEQAALPEDPEPQQDPPSSEDKEPPASDPEPEPENPPVQERQPELEGAFLVMIDNHSNARPQSGLDKADLVYEFICETGITRFLAAFYYQDPGKVGPIRSARYYFVQIAKAYNAPYVHIGGNMDAMALLKELKVRDMCGITNAGGYFYRDTSFHRKPPHNTYTTSELILKGAKAKGYPLVPLPELPTGELEGGEAAHEVEITYAKRNVVEWVYREDSKQYQRFINGNPHRTLEGGDILADNIVIIEAPVKTVTVPVDGVQSEIDIIDSGRAIFIRDGRMFAGSWSKQSPEEHFSFTLADGSTFKFKPGIVWIQQVPSIDSDVEIKTD